MRSFRYKITAPNGIHGRPASELARLAQSYRSRIVLECGSRQCDPRQLLKLMLAAVKQGETITVTVEGADEELCAEALEKALHKNF